MRNIIEILKKLSDESIQFDEPHVSQRIDQYGLSKEKILHYLLRQPGSIHKIVEDRKAVYKVYYGLSRKKQLKIVIQIKGDAIIVLTVAVLDKSYKIFEIGKVKRF